jgi:hypothetical protein
VLFPLFFFGFGGARRMVKELLDLGSDGGGSIRVVGRSRKWRGERRRRREGTREEAGGLGVDWDGGQEGIESSAGR